MCKQKILFLAEYPFAENLFHKELKKNCLLNIWILREKWHNILSIFYVFYEFLEARPHKLFWIFRYIKNPETIKFAPNVEPSQEFFLNQIIYECQVSKGVKDIEQTLKFAPNVENSS